MSNARRGEVEVSAGSDRKLVLCIDANVICSLEEKFEVETIQELAEKVGKRPRMTDLRTIVLFALKRNQPDATEEDAGDVISELGLGPAVDLIVTGLNGIVGGPPAAAKGGAPAKKASTPRIAATAGASS